jgi:hypothetical protein
MQRKGTIGLDEAVEKIGDAQSALVRDEPVGARVEGALLIAYTDLAPDPEAADLRRALAHHLYAVFKRRV